MGSCSCHARKSSTTIFPAPMHETKAMAPSGVTRISEGDWGRSKVLAIFSVAMSMASRRCFDIQAARSHLPLGVGAEA